MSKLVARCLLVVTVLMMVACSSVTTQTDRSSEQFVAKEFLAAGYSKRVILPNLTSEQNRFSIEQAATINAYRELARLIYNEKLSDDRVVADQVINNDLFRVYVDLYMREAQVIEAKDIADMKKMVLKLTLSPQFYHCVSSSVNVVTQCLKKDNKIPFTRIGYKTARREVVDLSCGSLSCTPRLSISGFSKEKAAFDVALLDVGLYDSEWIVNTGSKIYLRYLFLTNVIFE